jgi:hypothetical protein
LAGEVQWLDRVPYRICGVFGRLLVEPEYGTIATLTLIWVDGNIILYHASPARQNRAKAALFSSAVDGAGCAHRRD